MAALKAKNVFVTGGANGLGKCFTDYLLKAGARVVFGDKNAEAGKTTEKEFAVKYGVNKAHFLELDVTNQKQFEDVFKAGVQKLGFIDLMVNNAGIMNESVWELMLDINFGGVVRGTYIAMEHMRKDKGGKGGRIININSELGLDKSLIAPVYCATKHSSRAFTECVAISPNIDEMGVQLALLCPGATATDMVNNIEPHMVHHWDLLGGQKPKLGSVEIIAEAFMELASYDYMNGAILRIDYDEKQHYKMEKVKRTWPPSEEERQGKLAYKS